MLEITGPGLDVLFAGHDGAEAVVTNDSGKLPDVLRGFLAAIDEARRDRRAWHRCCLWIVVIACAFSLSRCVSWADRGRLRGDVGGTGWAGMLGRNSPRAAEVVRLDAGLAVRARRWALDPRPTGVTLARPLAQANWGACSVFARPGCGGAMIAPSGRRRPSHSQYSPLRSIPPTRRCGLPSNGTNSQGWPHNGLGGASRGITHSRLGGEQEEDPAGTAWVAEEWARTARHLSAVAYRGAAMAGGAGCMPGGHNALAFPACAARR